MTTYVSATEAARMLGVSKPTLYAYVSRGIVGRQASTDGRTSLYARDEVERLAQRRRRRAEPVPPTIDVQIASAITVVDEARLTYRHHDVAELVGRCSFEQVTELLLTGELPPAAPAWRLDRAALGHVRAALDAGHVGDPIARLAMAATVLSQRHGADTAADAGRRMLALAPSVLGGPERGSIAQRLTRTWARRPTPAVDDAVSAALVVLADHELATSTLAVRVACSVRADPYAAIATGLLVAGGPLHGGASSMVALMLAEAARDGSAAAVGGRLARGERLPGFGHAVYRNGDPRVAPLLGMVRRIPDRLDRLAVVDDVLAEAGKRIVRRANVDYALGALMFVADLPPTAPILGVARIAGWAAHYQEELGERPVRYRGLSARR
jgi:citrate synthase